MKKKSFNQVTRGRFEKIIENNDEKVRDHWCITGKFRGQLTGFVT